LVFKEREVELVTVEGPRGELERASLDVEREMCDVDWTGAEEDGLRNPQDCAVIGQNCHRFTVLLQSRVSTAINTQDRIFVLKILGISF